jgi:multidrug efflux pump subunit AcrA (membrane-fusion protein)
MASILSRWRWPTAGAVLLVLLLLWVTMRKDAVADATLVATVQEGPFTVSTTTSGELRAQKFVEITAPSGLQQAQVYQVKIQTLVAEGTRVAAGDVVAELDRSPVATKVAEVSLAVQKAQAVWEQARLDSTLNLSKAREELKTLELALEEKRIANEQARYEAPTIRRQAEIDLEKAQRALAQAKLDYVTKTEQAQAKMREVGADLERQRNLLGNVQGVMAGFTITAPNAGMVIYVKEWNGRKRTAGSQVSAWEPAVATLPDLSKMESVTYVNELDVRKIVVGQPAVITLDADPEKRFRGKVTAVANVGEQRPNTDAKVFEVKIEMEASDTTLRPGMTTGNAIETFRAPKALFVSLEALQSDAGIPFVYKQLGTRTVRQEVETGALSDDDVLIIRGLAAGDRVLLTPPKEAAQLPLERLPGSRAVRDTGQSRSAPSRADSGPVPSRPAASGGAAVPTNR